MEGLRHSSAASMLRQITFGTLALLPLAVDVTAAALKSERSRITVRPARFKSTLEDVAIEEVDIRVFNLSGTLVREIRLPLASGMYLVHFTAPEIGETVLKFGLIRKRIQPGLF